MPYCQSCKQDRPKGEFQDDPSRIMKVRSICRDCNRRARGLRRRKAKQRVVLKSLGIEV